MLKTLTGKLKFFSPKKHFGFVEVDNHPDIFLLGTVASVYGKPLLYGMTITLEAVCTEKGWTATRILATDGSTVTSPVPRSDFQGEFVTPEIADARGLGPWISAHVMWFSWSKGYGFYRRDDQRDIAREWIKYFDIFVHADMLELCGAYITRNDIVAHHSMEFIVSDSPRGFYAMSARRVHNPVNPVNPVNHGENK